MTKQENYNTYIKNFKAPDFIKPASFNEASKLISSVPHKMLSFSKNNDATAYATRSKNFGMTGIYNIYVNPEYTKSHDALLLHEEGHIVLGHLTSQAFNNTAFKMKVQFAWPKIRKLIEVGDDIKLSEKEIQDIYIKKVSQIMLNYAMDYEVNSKLFTKDEFDNFQKNFENDFMENALYDESYSEENYEKAVTEKMDDPTIKLVNGLWPEDVGFPCKLQFTQYIDLMVLNPEEFFQKIKLDNHQPQKNRGNEDGQQSEDGSSSGGDGQSGQQEQNNSGSGSSTEKITLEDLDDLAKAINDMDEEAMNKILEAAEQAEKELQGDDGDGEDDEDTVDGGFSEGHSSVGTGIKRNIIVDASKSKDLEKAILNAVFNKTVTNTRQDPVYNYNRKKYNSNVFIAKSRPEQLWRPGNIVLLVDCSGSIQEKAISAMINCVRAVAKKCGQKSRIVWWDTNLEGDYLLKNNKGPRDSGGTCINTGIDYVRKRYLKQSNDKLIIISDFEDYLDRWYDSLKTMKNDAVGLCWLYAKGDETPEKYLNYWLNTDEISMEKFLKRLPTTLVNIH